MIVWARVCMHVCVFVCVYEGPGTVVVLVTMGKEPEWWPSEWFIGGGWVIVGERSGTEWLAQGSSPNVRGQRGTPATAGTGVAEEKKDPFSWGRGPQGGGGSWIWVSEQENASSGCQGVRPVSWVSERPRRV